MGKQSQNSQQAVLQQICCAGQRDGQRGVQILIDSLQAHIYDDTVVQETSLLLTSLSKNPNNVAALMSIAVKPCMKALEVHQNETSVADALGEFLGQMPIEEDEQWGQALATSLLDKPVGSGSRGGTPLASSPKAAAGGYPLSAAQRQ